MTRRPRSLDDPDHPRRRLLAAATLAFGSRGYERTSLETIAEAAGLPKSGVYYYFPNKQALIAAIAEEAAGTLHARLDQIQARGLPADAELEQAIFEHVRLLAERLPAMRVLLRELPPDAPELQPIAAERTRYRHRLMAIVERGIREEVFTVVEPRIAAEAVIGLANGLVDWFAPTGRLSVAQVAETYAQLAVQALRRVGSDTG